MATLAEQQAARQAVLGMSPQEIATKYGISEYDARRVLEDPSQAYRLPSNTAIQTAQQSGLTPAEAQAIITTERTQGREYNINRALKEAAFFKQGGKTVEQAPSKEVQARLNAAEQAQGLSALGEYNRPKFVGFSKLDVEALPEPLKKGVRGEVPYQKVGLIQEKTSKLPLISTPRKEITQAEIVKTEAGFYDVPVKKEEEPDFLSKGYTGILLPGVPETQTFFPTYKQFGDFFGGKGAYSGYQAFGVGGGVIAGIIGAPRDIELFGRSLVSDPVMTVAGIPKGYVDFGKNVLDPNVDEFYKGQISGSFVAQAVIFGAAGKAISGIAGKATTLGKAEVPSKSFFDPFAIEALEEGRTIYPKSSGVPEMLVKFRKGAAELDLYNEGYKGAIIHTTDVIFDPETFARVGTSETPGLYGTPPGRASPAFARLMESEYPSIKLSLNPFESLGKGKPAAYEVLLEEPVQRIPKTELSSYARAQEFFGTSRTKFGKQGKFSESELLPVKAPKGKAFISPAAEFGKRETEAILPAGTKLKRVFSKNANVWEQLTGFERFTKVKGKGIPIFKYAALKEGKLVGNIITAEELGKKVSREYRSNALKPSLVLSPIPLFSKASKARSLKSSIRPSRIISGSYKPLNDSYSRSLNSRVLSSSALSSPGKSRAIFSRLLSSPKSSSKASSPLPVSSGSISSPPSEPVYSVPPSRPSSSKGRSSGSSYTPPYSPPSIPASYLPPNYPKEPPGYYGASSRGLKDIKQILGYIPYIRKRGRFLKASAKALPKNEAKRLGAMLTMGSASRTFTLKPAGLVEEKEGAYFTLPQDVFKTKKGKQGLLYIERRGKTIKSRREYLDIRYPKDLL